MKIGKINSLFNFLDKKMNLNPQIVSFELDNKDIFCIEVPKQLFKKEREKIVKAFGELDFLEKQAPELEDWELIDELELEVKLAKEIIIDFDGTIILDKGLLNLNTARYVKIKQLYYFNLADMDKYYEDLL